MCVELQFVIKYHTEELEIPALRLWCRSHSWSQLLCYLISTIRINIAQTINAQQLHRVLRHTFASPKEGSKQEDEDMGWTQFHITKIASSLCSPKLMAITPLSLLSVTYRDGSGAPRPVARTWCQDGHSWHRDGWRCRHVG